MTRTEASWLAGLVLAAPFVVAGGAPGATIEINLLYVHGVKSCQAERQNAQGSFTDLEQAVNADLPGRIASYQAAHPGTTIVTHSGRANLYTATPSGYHPSDSPDPINMDDWKVGDPGCSTTQQGDPCTTAYEWRYRLAQEIDRLYPAPASNVILIGHSSGARVALEVAANVGTGGVGSTNWGVQSRIGGVVTIQGMVDALGGSNYNVAGPTSFETAGKNGDAISGFGSSCAPGNGWCEYAGRVDGLDAGDWVAKNRRALMLTSWASCSPAAWTGWSDGSLPYDAQASPWALGLDMTPAPGQTYRPSHGQKYGSFCHSAIDHSGDANHAAALTAAKTRILDWLFTAAPRVAVTGSNSTSGSIAYNQFSSTFTMWPVDPPTSGVRLLVTDASAGTVVDAAIPGGAYNYATQTGWKSNPSGTRWGYRNGLGGVQGIVRLSLKVGAVPGVLQFAASGRNGGYPVGGVPVHVTVALDATTGRCAEASFAGPPPAPSCALSPSGSSLGCK